MESVKAGGSAGDVEPAPVESPSAWSGLISQWFGIDTRSLAVVRVGTASVLLVDLYYRATSLRAFYTDDGVLPRAELITRHHTGDYGMDWCWSLHLASGQTWFQAGMFLLAAWFALQLLLGYRTRRAAIVSVVLLLSLQYRNHLIQHGGDVLLRCLVFWLCWVPSGAVWSVDAALTRRSAGLPRRVTTFGTAAFLLQLAAMYVLSALMKHDPSWSGPLFAGPGEAWKGANSAVWMALANSHFADQWGHWVGQSTELCWYLTVATYYLELYGVALAFSPLFPGWLRFACVLAFWGFHGSLILTMRIGHFPYTAMVFWCGFLPTVFWDALARRWSRSASLRIGVGPGDRVAEREARLARELHGLSAVVPIAFDPAVTRGWRVERDGQHLPGWSTLARQSAVFGPLGPLVALLPLGWLGRAVARAVERHERPAAQLGLIAGTVAVVMVVYTSLWNLRGLDDWHRREHPERWLPYAWNGLGRASGLNQEWSMFSPYPMRDDGWYVLRGTLGNGRLVDLWVLIDGRFERMGDSEVYEGPPPEFLDTEAKGRAQNILDVWSRHYPTEDWQKFMVNLWYHQYREYRPLFVGYLRRRWQQRIDDTPGYSQRERARLERDERLYQKQLTQLRKDPSRYRDAISQYEHTLAQLVEERAALEERRASRQLVKVEMIYMMRLLPKDLREPILPIERKNLWTWTGLPPERR